MAENKALRVAVVGVGAIGQHHARVYDSLPEAELVAVVDSDADLAARVARRYGCDRFGSVESLLESTSVDALSIAVPTPLHLDVALPPLGAGIACLVEKPIAIDLRQATTMANMASRSGALLAVGHVERFNPAVRAMKGVVEAGAIGEVVSVSARRVGPVPPARQNSDVVVDLAVHDIDVAAYLLDESPRLVASSCGSAHGGPHPDWADLTLDVGGVSCLIQVNWLVPLKIRTLALIGTKGYAELNYISQAVQLYEAVDWSSVHSFDEFVERFGEPKSRSILVERAEPLLMELRSFLGSVRAGTPPEVDSRSAMRALAVALDALAWCRERRSTRFTHDVEDEGCE